MSKLVCVLSSFLLLLTIASAAYSQSLADLAKKEKERREAVKAATKVITNEETAKHQNAPVTTGVPPTPAEKSGPKRRPTQKRLPQTPPVMNP